MCGGGAGDQVSHERQHRGERGVAGVLPCVAVRARGARGEDDVRGASGVLNDGRKKAEQRHRSGGLLLPGGR